MKKLLSISILTASSLLAVSPNTDAIQKSISTSKFDSSKKSQLVDISGINSAPLLAKDIGGNKILIKNFVFEGNAHIPSSQLDSLVKEFKNKELSFAQLQNIASNLTKEYRNKGYFVSRVYIPKQNIQQNNNTLKFAVIEGNYGDLKLKNNSNVKDFVIQAILNNTKNKDSVITTNSLERSMLLINDGFGAVVTKADVKPGKKVGTSDFIIQTEKKPFVDGYVVGDNYGSKYTGKSRVMSGINLNSPFKIGDRLSIDGLRSNNNDMNNYKFAYNFPLMANGLRGQTSYSKTTYNLVDLGQTTPDGIYDGNSSIVEAGVTYPIIRSKMENLNISAFYDSKKLKDYYDSAVSKDRDINSLKIGLNHSKEFSLFGLDTKTTAEGILTYGKLDIKDTTSKEQDKAGVNTQGNYSKINVNMGGEIFLTPIYALNTNIKTQYALGNKNLDGSEDFTVGGVDGVKVFTDSEENAENGVVFSTELSANLPQIKSLTHKVGLFYDIGKASMSDNSKDSSFNSRTLQDVGLGYYANYKNAFGKVQVARVVGKEDIETENQGDISKILFQGGFVF